MAVFEQERHVELVPGAAEAFFITSRMVSAITPNELPHLNVFVISVVDVTDPTQDVLARVANLADLSLIPIGRTLGIAAPGANGIEYLADSSTVHYDTLETANDAAKAFRDRVNALIEGWIDFRTNFNAPDPTPAFYTMPFVDASQKTVLINAYSLAKQAGYAQLQVKTEADAALTRAQTDYTYKSSLLTGITTIVTNTTNVKNEFTTVVAQFGALLTAGNVFYGLNTGGPGATAFAGALATATAQQTAMPGYLTDANTALVNSTNYQTARQNDANTSATGLASAQANQITQAQTLTAANATTAAALAALLAVCPDFDPTTIPYVPG
jgi:hypothetical protein